MAEEIAASTAPTPRQRKRVKVIGALVTTALVIAYVAVLLTYQRSLSGEFAEPEAPASALAIEIVPTQVLPVERQVRASLLLFPSGEFLDAEGRLKESVTVVVSPTVANTEILFPAGRIPSPKELVLPVSGLVQAYPFDTYDYRASVQAHVTQNGEEVPIPVDVGSFFRLAGWSLDADQDVSGAVFRATASGTIARDFSTIGIALLLLALMVIIAGLVVRVVRSVAANRMELNLFVASWITALLFALLPLRNSLPGSPPLGSWIDILMYFWVVAVVMVSLAFVTGLLLARAKKPSESTSD